jgi:hypothetical protein
MTIGRVKYPDVEYPDDLDIYPDGFKDYVVFVEEKRDGSQMCIWFDGEKNRISSRNRDAAIFSDKVAALPEVNKWILFLHCFEDPTRYVVFGEYISRGYGPTKVEGYNDRDVFVAFDIYDRGLGGFLWSNTLMEIVSEIDVPMVKVLHVFDREDGVIEKAEEIVKNLTNREGVVLKIYHPQKSVMSYVAKLKNRALIEREAKKKERKKVGGKAVYDMSLPTIPDDKIYRAVNNCFHVEFDGYVDAFKDKGNAMPLVVEYVKIECAEHGFSMPRGNKIYQAYAQFLKDRGVVI